MQDSPDFRILALDGGGIKGTFTASLLATWERETQRRIVDHFDLIAGTSTGGIIALALGLELSGEQILEFYRQHGASIFPNLRLTQKLPRKVRHLLRPKYSADPLKTALQSVFHDRKLGESRCRLLIPTYDAVRGRNFLLKTAHHPRFNADHRSRAVDIALATSAAPTFFEPSKLTAHQDNKYVDGGLWANCPALAAVVEAHCFLNVPFDRIRVLSLGTTNEPAGLLRQLDSSLLLRFLPLGALRWAPHLMGVMFQSQMETSLATTKLLTGGRLFRVDHTAPSGSYALDSSELVDELAALGRGKAVEKDILDQVTTGFLNGKHSAPFVPCHKL